MAINFISEHPLISVILCVKNGMPYLPQAISSVQSQKYRNFELVIQDGVSTDGTLEFLRNLTGIPSIRIESLPDSGIGQAMNRAQHRCQGEIIAEIDADNLMYPHTLETVTRRFRENPDAAVIYAAQDSIDQDGNLLGHWCPDNFDLLSVIECRLVPPYGTSYLHKANCGEDLRTEENMKTCSDYDFWLRIGSRKVIRITDNLGATRVSSASETARPESYKSFCRDKIAALNRFCEKQLIDDSQKELIRAKGTAGIYLWAAESVRFVYPSAEGIVLFGEFCQEAEKYDPRSERLEILRKRDEETRVRKQSAAIRLEAQGGPRRLVYTEPNLEQGSESTEFLLLDLNLEGLAQKLEKNFYLQSDQPQLGLWNGSIAMLQCDPRDHLSTPFFDLVPNNSDKNETIILRLSYDQTAKSALKADITLQDDGYRSIMTQRSDPSQTYIEREIKLGPDCSSLRLNFSCALNQHAVLPSRISIAQTNFREQE